MKRKLVLYPLLVTICFFCSANLFAQKNLTTMTGKANGQSLLDAAVREKRTNRFVAIPADATLVLSYVGYGTREIKTASRSSPTGVNKHVAI